MYRFLLAMAAAVAVTAGAPGGVLGWPWADDVLLYNPGPGIWQWPFRDETRLIGQPWGISEREADNSSVATLGDGGTVTLGFDDPIYDDPRNTYGLDFIVFSNCIWAGEGGVQRFQEPAFVEVSENGLDWFLILPNILPADLKKAPQPGQDTGTSSTVLRGYAECTPTMALPPGVRAVEFYTIPDRPSYQGDPESLLIDPGSGGGDGMDIAWAVRQSSPGVPETGPGGNTIPALLSSIRFVRITDAATGDSQPPLGEISAEIDAVATTLPPPQRFSECIREPAGRLLRFDDALIERQTIYGAFVRSIDGSAGAYVAGIPQVQPGRRLKAIGRMHDLPEGRQMETLIIDLLEQIDISEPPTVPMKALTSGRGVSPVGLVVRTWGKVRYDDAPSWFFLEGPDGSNIRVTCPFKRPAEGSLVRVTGGTRQMTSGLVTLQMQDQSDLVLLAGP